MTSRLPGIVRMEDALIEIDKRTYFGLVDDGCGWIENRLDSCSTSDACCRDQNVVGGGQFARDNYRMLPIIGKHQPGTVQSVLRSSKISSL